MRSTTTELIANLLFSLSNDSLTEIRKVINANTNLKDETKAVMNKAVDNAIGFNLRLDIIKKNIGEFLVNSSLKPIVQVDELDSDLRQLADRISVKDSIESIANDISIMFDKFFPAERNVEKMYINIATKVKKDILIKMLTNVDDYYEDFIIAVLSYVNRKEQRYELVIEYIENHPEALSTDILEFISNQSDFYEDMIE